jgi:hypothetical protein
VYGVKSVTQGQPSQTGLAQKAEQEGKTLKQRAAEEGSNFDEE